MKVLFVFSSFIQLSLCDLMRACFSAVFATDVDGVRGLNSGFWNSIHVIEAIQLSDKKFEYKLTTTVIVRALNECVVFVIAVRLLFMCSSLAYFSSARHETTHNKFISLPCGMFDFCFAV